MANKKKIPPKNQAKDDVDNTDKDVSSLQEPVLSELDNKPNAAIDSVNATPEQPQALTTKNKLERICYSYWERKRWTLPVTFIVLVGVLLAVPFTRYQVLGLFFQEDAQVKVVDSGMNTPVPGAELKFGRSVVTTSDKGVAYIKLPVGNDTLTASKQYYKSAEDRVLVTFSNSQNTFVVRLVATGRQVPVSVVNKVTGKPVANAEVKVLDTYTKTDGQGKAIIVLPANQQTESGSLSANGFNNATVTVHITGQTVAANTYTMTPSGRVFFLSNLSGKIDVVSTNLDGTDRKTVLAGTGNEEPGNTVLLASRDWKYLALLAQRKSTGNPELDLINTATGQMSNMDEGNATFTPVGWDGDDFIYEVNRTSVQSWQSGQEALKSFNANTKSITLLAQTAASGTNQYNYLGQQIGQTYIIGNQVVYTMDWSGSYNIQTLIRNDPATLNVINPDGSGYKTIKSFYVGPQTYTTYNSVNIQPYDGPNSLAVQYNVGSSTQYYEYQNGRITASSDINDQNFYRNYYATYLLSPSGKQTFWSVPADGKNNLLIGDQNGDSGKQIAQLSDYAPYGWFTDSYLLVSKNASQLYIMPVNGGTPLPISDYFKPSQYFRGYGGGYGGL